jgi:hypothetical protein
MGDHGSMADMQTAIEAIQNERNRAVDGDGHLARELVRRGARAVFSYRIA